MSDGVEIKWSKAYRVDNDKGVVEEVLEEGNLAEYIMFYVGALSDQRRVAPYRLRSSSTEAIVLMREIVQQMAADKPDDTLVYEKSERISERFLEKEMDAQKKIERLHTAIRNGCLIHACIFMHGKMYYLIAKLNWETFLDGVHLSRRSGILFDKKMLGRSCLASFSQDIKTVEEIRVSLDSSAVRYFVDDFLEIDAEYSDEYSTEKCSENVVALIDHTFAKSHPRVRLDLKNAFLIRLRSEDFISYEQVVDGVFRPYFTNSDCPVATEKAEAFLAKLDSLPDEKKFASQFQVVPARIKKRIIETEYNLGSGMTLLLKEPSTVSLNNRICSGHDEGGRTYLKVYTDDAIALRAFSADEQADITNSDN